MVPAASGITWSPSAPRSTWSFQRHWVQSRYDGVADGLQRYEALRKPRATQVQLMSRGREIRNHLPDGPGQRARDAALGGGEPLRQSAWIYGYDA